MYTHAYLINRTYAVCLNGINKVFYLIYYYLGSMQIKMRMKIELKLQYIGSGVKDIDVENKSSNKK